MSYALQDIEDIKSVEICQCISKAGTVQVPNTINLGNVQFTPDFAIIRSINVRTDTANNNLYLLYSDLINDYIGSFTGAGVSVAYDKVFAIKKPIVQQVSIDVRQVTTDQATGVTAPTLAGTWFLDISIEFVKLKKYQQNKVIYKKD